MQESNPEMPPARRRRAVYTLAIIALITFVTIIVLLPAGPESFPSTPHAAIDVDSPASEDLFEEFSNEHAILTPEEIRQIEAFLSANDQNDVASDTLLQASELPYDLLSTDISDGAFDSSAIFFIKARRLADRFRIGEEIFPGIPLVYVSRTKAFVRNGQWLEYFNLKKST